MKEVIWEKVFQAFRAKLVSLSDEEFFTRVETAIEELSKET